MLMGPRGASPQPVSSRKEAAFQSAQVSEDQSVQSDTDNTARDLVSDGRRQPTAFDKVLSKRLEKKPDDSAETVSSEEPSGDAPINSEAELTLAKILAQFSRHFETPPVDGGTAPAQMGSTPASGTAVSVQAQAQSATIAAAVPSTPAAPPAPVGADGQAAEPPAQTTDKMLFSQPGGAKEQTPLPQAADSAAPAPAAADQNKAASEKQPTLQTADKVQPPIIQAPAEKPAPVSQTADAAAVSGKQAVSQDSINKPVPDAAGVSQAKPETDNDAAKLAQAKDFGQVERSESSAEMPAVHAGISEQSAVSNVHSAAAAGAAQPAVQAKIQTAEVIDKPTVSVTETAEVSRVRASDPVNASRTADQIAQKLSLEQPIRADQQIRLTLSPQELGTVRITFREQAGEVVGLLEVQKPQTRRELEDSMPQLLSSMQGQGVQVRRIEVVQWNAPQQQSRDSLSDSFNPSAEREFLQQRTGQSHDGSSQQRGFAQSNGFTAGPGKTSSADTYNPQEYFSDKGLNLYI